MKKENEQSKQVLTLAEKIVDALESRPFARAWDGTFDYQIDVRQMVDIVNKFLSALNREQNEWREIKDGLPEESGLFQVTVRSRKNQYSWVECGMFRHYKKDFLSSVDSEQTFDEIGLEVLAWKPVSKPFSPDTAGEKR